MGCSTQAAYVSASVTIFPCREPPLHVPRDFSIESRVSGSILNRYVHTQGNTMQSRSKDGHGHGSPNMPCFSYLSSCDHSDRRKLGHSSSVWARFRESLGSTIPFLMASASDLSDMGGQVSGSVQVISPVLIAWRWWAMTFI
jgi:hypothetical protein